MCSEDVCLGTRHDGKSQSEPANRIRLGIHNFSSESKVMWISHHYPATVSTGIHSIPPSGKRKYGYPSGVFPISFGIDIYFLPSKCKGICILHWYQSTVPTYLYPSEMVRREGGPSRGTSVSIRTMLDWEWDRRGLVCVWGDKDTSTLQ